MLIDCDTCRARPRACGDCVVSHLLAAGPPVRADGASGGLLLDASERAAVSTLAAAGLVPPLRLVPPGPDRQQRPGDRTDGDIPGSSLNVTSDARPGDDMPGMNPEEPLTRDIA